MDIETNHIVVDILQRALSQIPAILKSAEEKLKEWETQPGFYAVLTAISNCATDENVRMMALICMKNGVDKYWTRDETYIISENEKHNIRQNLLSNFSEPINQIAVQRAVLISKIAQSDYKQWPELSSELLKAVEEPEDCLIQHRVLLAMHHVIKAIDSEVKHEDDKVLFHKFTVSIYPYVFKLWEEYTGALVGIVQDDDVENLTLILEMALLTLKILRKLSVFGFNETHENRHYCVSFVNLIFEKVQTILQCRRQVERIDIYALELYDKFVVELTKVLISIMEVHNSLYVKDFLRPTLELACHYLFTDEGRSLIFERFVVQCLNALNLLKLSLWCSKYDPAMIPLHDLRREFFQPEKVLHMFRTLVDHYFILTRDELNLMDVDPEDFANDKILANSKGPLRANAEELFISLSREFKDCFIIFLKELVVSTNVLVPPQNLQDILKKDAAYRAVSLRIFDLKDKIDLTGWLVDTLLRDWKVKDNNYKVIRIQVLSVIQRLIQCKFSNILISAVYDCITESLSSNEDMVVRLAAMSTLDSAIRYHCSSGREFEKFIYDAYNLLFTLLKESRQWNTKQQVLIVMDDLLMYVGSKKHLQLASLTQYLLSLWKETEEHNALRCSILHSLVFIVEALEDVERDLILLLVPVVQFGTDISQDDKVELLDDYLHLWLTVLEYSPTITDDLMRAFHKMPSLLENSTDTLYQSLLICVANLLLAPELFIRTSGPRIIEICAGLISNDLLTEELTTLAVLVETFVRTSPILGAETVLPILPKLFEKIYVAEDNTMLAITFCTLSRTLLASHEAMSRVLNAFARAYNGTELAMLGSILDVWLEKMKAITQPNHLKLLSLALTNMLTAECGPVLERFSLIMSNIARALNAIIIEKDGTMTDPLVLKVGQDLSEFQENNFETMTYSVRLKVKKETITTTNEEEIASPHDRRKKQMILFDPVHQIILTDYLQSQWCELRNKAGEQQFQLLLQCLDADTISVLKKYKFI